MINTKKATSVFIIGLVVFFLLGFFLVGTEEILDRISFQEYAGKDAAALTRLQRISESQVFFIETTAKYYFKTDFSSTREYLKNQGIELENTTHQKYTQRKQDLLELIEAGFNNYYKEKVNEYNKYLQSRIRSGGDMHIIDRNTEFKLYEYNGKLKGIALRKQKVLSFNANGYSYYFPHFSINMPKLDFVENIETVKKERVKLHKCLKQENTFDHCKDQSSIDIVGSQIDDLVDITMVINDYKYKIKFKI